MASLMAQWAKNLPAIQETQKTRVRSPGQEDPLEKEMATHSSTLAWEIPWTAKPVRHIWDVINFLFYTLSDPSILLGLWFRAAHWDDVLKICLLCCYRHPAYDFSLAGVLKVHLAFSFPSPQHIKHYLWNPQFLPGVLVQIAQNQISSESQACIYQTLGIASAWWYLINLPFNWIRFSREALGIEKMSTLGHSAVPHPLVLKDVFSVSPYVLMDHVA